MVEYLILPVGIAGSGKTTLRRLLEAQIDNLKAISFDEWRKKLIEKEYPEKLKQAKDDIEKYSLIWNIYNENRKKYNSIFYKRRYEIMQNFKTIYVDNTNLTTGERDKFTKIAPAKDALIIHILFFYPFSVYEKTNFSRRDKRLPVEALQRQYDKLSTYPGLNERIDILFLVRSYDEIEKVANQIVRIVKGKDWNLVENLKSEKDEILKEIKNLKKLYRPYQFFIPYQ